MRLGLLMNDSNGQFFHQNHIGCFCDLCYLTSFNWPWNQHQTLSHESGISKFLKQIHISLLILRIDLPSNAKYCQTSYSTNNTQHPTNLFLRSLLYILQFWSPDDEQMCSKYVHSWNKLIVKQKFCASSWLITEIIFISVWYKEEFPE